MDTWQTLVLVLVAVMAGASLPVLVQVSTAARSARSAIDRIATRLDPALAAATAAFEHLQRIGSRLDDRRIDSFVEAVNELSRTANHLRDTLRVASAVGAAVGPAVGAAVRAWRAPSVADGSGQWDGGDPGDAPGRESVK